MRYGLAVVAVSVLGFGFVVHERRGVLEHHLGQVATQLSGRQVKVHCQGVTGELLDATAEAGSVGFGPGGPSDTTDLKRPICTALNHFRDDAAGAGFACVLANQQCDRHAWESVMAVHTLAHESWHLAGVTSEAVTECKSVQTTAQAAALLGAGQPLAGALARYYWTWFYPHMPNEYRTAECYDGGPLDARPGDRSWP